MKQKTSISLILGGVFSLVAPNAFAADVLPNGLGNLNDVVVPNATPQPLDKSEQVRVTVRATCFGTNLRSVSNPVAPGSVLSSTITFGSDTRNISLRVGQSTHVDMNNPVIYRIDGGGNIEREGTEGARATLSGWYQDAPSNGGQYMARDGAVTPQLRRVESANGGTVTFVASFPGQNGFCGGYYSPLMVFFDERRPSFTGKSLFPLNPSQIASWWPEKDAEGYFLAYDRNNDGRISEANELFGPHDGSFKNGFEHLRELDSNVDGVIDWKDSSYSNLLLWKDANADGSSQRGEISSLGSHRIKFLSLKYQDRIVTPVADRAEMRERAAFVYEDISGRSKLGQIVDVWFSSADSQSMGTLGLNQ